MEDDLWDYMPIGTNIEFNFARSDQLYRQGMYQRALYYAELAASMTKDKGFDKDVLKANQRISHLKRLIHKDPIEKIPSESFVERILEMTDESCFSANSADVESSDNE